MVPGAMMDGPNAEHIIDAARVLGRYADAIGIRAFPGGSSWEEDRRDPVIDTFVREAGVPIVNMESSLYHPNQALGDLLTIRERYGPDLQGLPVTITWTNHPHPLPMAMPNSILLTCARFGIDIRLLRPNGYDLDPEITERAREFCTDSGGSLLVTDDIQRGYEGSKVVYAKSWGSLRAYGNRDEERAMRGNLIGWMVDREKMEATDGAVFMHCLPVRRNVVVSDEIIDGEASMVYDQAENRLHAQKAVLASLLS
jgi:N-acetylornithine carbamoyltransferase